jgi:peptidoglycan/LPS O-acetylase OafA/YrhL
VFHPRASAPIMSTSKTMRNAQQLQTIPSLNGIRAISVLLVVLAHSGFGTIVPGGLGVTIFFFLSGYLITTLMITESQRVGNIAILSFYARRIFRLAPALLITLTIAYGLTYFGLLPGRITLEGLTAQLLYFANYYTVFLDPSNSNLPAGTGPLWSLAVEEHFYIVFPLLMTSFMSNAWRPRTIAMVFFISCLVILAWRIHLVHSPEYFTDRTYLASDTRIDSIIYGCQSAAGSTSVRKLVFTSVGAFFNWNRSFASCAHLPQSCFSRNLPLFAPGNCSLADILFCNPIS